MNSDDNHVNVGNFDANGLNVNNTWDDNRWNNIGVSSARKYFLCGTLTFHSWSVGVSVFSGFYPSAEHSAYFINGRL